MKKRHKANQDGSVTVTTTIRLTDAQKARAIQQLSKLDGIPPYDGGSNIVRGDGYFAKSIEAEYGLPLNLLCRASGYDKVKARWESIRASFRPTP